MLRQLLFLIAAFLTPYLQAADYSQMVGSALPSFDPENVTASVENPLIEFDALPSGDRIGRISSGLSANLSSGGVTTRGASDIKAFNNLSSSVVLILADGGSGSGSVIDSKGHVLTNWHVVGAEKTVDVIYRPVDVSQEAYGEKTFTARVLKVDQVSDLALIKIISPKKTVKPLSLARSQPMIGEDVSAIGHPLGYSWSYTKGIVTGVRDDHSWQYDTGFQHSAKVIQTQTPINPGNSGGPLFNAAGDIIGVNSFKSGGEAVNFAVSADAVREFLDSSDSRYAPIIPGTRAYSEFTGGCEPEVIGESWISQNQEHVLTGLDLTCDASIDLIMYHPTNGGVRKFEFDTNQDGYVDVTLIDVEDDESWDLSFFDVDADGTADVVGYHTEEGGSTPVEFSSYRRFQAMMNS